MKPSDFLLILLVASIVYKLAFGAFDWELYKL